MLKNLSYTPPTIGRIAIGEKVDDGTGRLLPRKLSHFIITAQHKRDGRWEEHPIADLVATQTNQEKDKITWIPIKVLFNDPDLIVRERCEAYDSTGRMICAGDQDKARRMTDGRIKEVPCPGCDFCDFGADHRCRLMTRLNVLIDVNDPNGRYLPDPLSTFIARTTGYNSTKSVSMKLRMLSAHLGNRLIGVPLILKLRMKSSPLSYGQVFYFFDIVPAQSMLESARLAKDAAEEMLQAGLNQDAMEAIVKEGLRNGPFEDTGEDAVEVLDYVDLSLPSNAPAEASVVADTSPDLVEAEEEAGVELPPPPKPDAVGMDALRAFLATQKVPVSTASNHAP